MSTFNLLDIRNELTHLLRNSDIFGVNSTTIRGVVTQIDNSTATAGQTIINLTKTNPKNIRSLTINSIAVQYLKDFTVNWNTGVITLTNALNLSDTISVQYDYGTGDSIYPDLPRCFTDSAELLTSSGFKNIKDIKEGDIILTYNLQQETYEYQPVINKIESFYSGEMIRIQNLQINTLVTPNHKFVIRDGNKLWSKLPFLREAKDLKVGNRIIRTAKWVGENIEYIELSENKKKFYSFKPQLKIDIDDFVALLGIYLSEGSINKHDCVIISQYKEKSRQHIKELLLKIGLKFGEGIDGFFISDYRLVSILKKYGSNYYDKFIPQEIKNLPPDKLAILLKWLIIGDGTPIDKSDDSWEYYTTSKQLSDDIQEITIKSGRATKYRIKRAQNSTCDCYAIKIYGIKRYSNMRLFKNNITSEYFEGKVYCVTTYNSTIVVRDNKQVFISGNSDLTLTSYPRVGIEILSSTTEPFGLGGMTHISDFLISIIVWVSANKDTNIASGYGGLSDLQTCIYSVRNALRTNAKSLYTIPFITPSTTGPLVKGNYNKVLQMNQDFNGRFKVE
jgi:hypothetical protein